MAIAYIEGFDKYGPGFTTFQTASVQSFVTIGKEFTNEWAVSTTGITGGGIPYIGPPLSLNGASLGIDGVGNGGILLTHTFTTNFSKAIGGVRFQCNQIGGNVNTGIVLFKDGGTIQAQLQYNATTSTLFLSNNSSVIATFSGVIAPNTTHYIEWNITMSSSGAYQIWLDGVSLGSGTGSFHTTANNFYNQIVLQSAGNGVNVGGPAVAFDDLYVDDGTGSALNTNPIVDTEFATSDSAVQFTNGGFAVGYQNSNSTGTITVGANGLQLRKITPPVNCTLNSVTIVPTATSASAKFKAVLYADSAGSPGALVATGTEVIGTTANTPRDMPFASGQALTASTSYWIGYIGDTSVAVGQENQTTSLGWYKNNTYASGAPNPAGSPTIGAGGSFMVWGNMSGIAVNWRDISQNINFGVFGDYSYVTDNTVGHEDLYGVAPLATTPSTIYAVKVSAYMKDSAAGSRTVTINTKSNTTDSPGTNTGVTPITTYGWFSSYWLTDPNTAAAWTQSGLNAALMGFKITA
jgi:hypothetical protein